MDDYALYLSEEAKSDIVALHQFKILYDDTNTSLHFFFEGEEDSLFYMPEARRYTGVKVTHIYDCGGKRNVIEVRDAIVAEGYDASSCLFFVDRDFDDLLACQITGSAETYITDNYSIENDISTAGSLRVLFEDIIRISRADPEFLKAEELVHRGYEVFYQELRPLIAWILAAKEANCSPNLRNTTGLKGIVTLEGVTPSLSRLGFKEFKKKVVTNGKLPPISRVIAWRRKLDVSLAKSWVRGKYDIWYFQQAALAALAEISSRRKAAKGRAVRVPNSLREGRLFELLGGRVMPPDSLQEFLQRRLVGGASLA